MHPPLRIALISSEGLPGLYAEEAELLPRLRARGVEAEVVIWSDPSVDWGRYDLAAVRSAWDYFERADEFRAWLDRMKQAAIPLQNPIPLIRWNMDKLYLRELSERGVRIVPTAFFERGQRADLLALLKQRGWADAVVKPTVSGGAYRTHRTSHSDAAALQPTFDALVDEVGALVQPFVPEIQTEGEWSLFFFAGAFSHAVLKVPAKDEYRVQPQFGGQAHRVTPDEEMLADAQRIVALAPTPLLYARVDGVRSGGRLMLMELEAIEPYLFFAAAPEAMDRYVDALIEAAQRRR